MNSAVKLPDIMVARADLDSSILLVTGPNTVSIRAGTIVEGIEPRLVFERDTPLELPELVAGQDYGVRRAEDGRVIAVPIGPEFVGDHVTFAGFHFAPSGNAAACAGGDGQPAINPFSCWDANFRPACPDPRGMTLVELPDGKRFWADIYLLGAEHVADGTSRFGVTMADGRDLPAEIEGGRYRKLDFRTAQEIYAHHGKGLLGAEEFFAAAYGATERASREREPKLTGEADGFRFVSRRGLFDATGTMWQWGTDGHPDDPRPSLFGGYWVSGGYAGSRRALLVDWPEDSGGDISARGRSDHLKPA